MAASGSQNFTLTCKQILQSCFEDSTIYRSNEAIKGDDITRGKRVLNVMIKAWQGLNIGLWQVKEGILFPALEGTSYSLGLTGDHATKDFVSTTLASAALISATTLTLTSNTGMTAADQIGIELDDGTRQWTTIVSVGGSNTVVITTPLTAASAASNTVVSYTTKINRPLSIVAARRFDLVSLTDIEIDCPADRSRYFNIVNKTMTGTPLQIYYDKQIPLGKMYVYLACGDVREAIKFTYYDVIDDFDNLTDNADFPEEWLEAIIAGGAYRLARTYRKPPDVLRDLKSYAEEAFAVAKNSNAQDGYISMYPEHN
jgi:hypothetical protein